MQTILLTNTFSLDFLKQDPVPLMCREGCQHCFITTQQCTSYHITFSYQEAEPLCSLTSLPPLWMRGMVRAGSTHWIQNHKCLFLLPKKN